MDSRSTTFRLTAWLAATSLLATGILAAPPLARAQDASVQGAGPPNAGDATADDTADPPGRVGRLSRLQGSVSTHGAGATTWTPAVLNFPFVSGDALWTQPQAQADIEVGASLATLADSTELDLGTLDDHTLVAAEPQGAIFLDVRDLQPGDTYTIDTPRGAVQIAAAGEYEILAGDTSTPTRVVVVRGAAQLTSGALALRAGQGQMAVATGAQDVQGDVEPISSYDPFLTAMLQRNSVPPNEPQAVQGMTGAEGLGQYGSWQQSPEYGQVWYPQVSPDWVPYRDGSWSYVEPWGWTWVDDEPWGFAPFHYGRWAQVGPRWCWVPGQEGAPIDADPVYAPALVDFLVAGAVAGAAVGLLAASLRSGRGDVGWVPLGPREAYAPPYGASRRYLGRMNRGNGWHRPQWGGAQDHNAGGAGFANRRALTIAPASALTRSQQIRPLAHGMDSPAARGFQTASVQSLRGPLPMRPGPETRGLTASAAQRLGLAGRPAHPAAPGPAINPAMLHQAAAPGGRIPFRTVAGPAATHGAGPRAPALPHAPGSPHAPGGPLAPHLAAPHPGDAAMPALRGPATGTVPQRPAAPHFAAPRPQQSRVQPSRTEPSRAEPRPQAAFRPAPAPAPIARPMAPAMQMQRPMAQPHSIAPRAMPAPHAAPPPGGHPAGRPDHP